ncbi:glycosyltransferase [Donghicola sp. XS_ASV15]|uniref:glycosyltransferase n=1 Tax=Donghicola sp. XS_ASV15 TaxID=3241295 RepID=UPI0035162FEB
MNDFRASFVEGNSQLRTLHEESASRDDQRRLRLFDPFFYEAFYPDLSAAGVVGVNALAEHYLKHGQEEGRVSHVGQWLTSKGLPHDLFENLESWMESITRIRSKHPAIELNTVLEGLLFPDAPAYEYFEEAHLTSRVYENLSRVYLTRGMLHFAENFLKKSVRFNPENGPALELLGNIEIDRGNFADAMRLYKLALEAGHRNDWLFLNLSKAQLALGQIEESYDVALNCVQYFPEFTHVIDHLDAIADALWGKTEAETTVEILCNRRDDVIAKIEKYTQEVYHAYLQFYGAEAPPKFLGDVNLGRILIVGDFVVPQCVRYRIDQKIEHLQSVGVDAIAVNWMEVGDDIDCLAFYDTVIFYRVPALPKVLKAMAQVTAAGKLAIYEVDDLIFEPVYPLPLHTYGTLVDEDQYAGLVRGMALYNAAARCCRVGLASTQPLADRLGPLTQSGTCLLLRNGLDSQNTFRLLDRDFKETVDLFYGSGTKAHNSDLIEIILPVMEQILPKHPQARFVLMGYAQLPQEFMDKFESQILHLPFSDNVKSYYETLQWVDINLAVLHSDEINDCKSELKWFEAACFGIPSVLSSTANYRDVIEDKVDGFLARTTPEWVSAIDQLIGDKVLRKAIGQKAYNRVRTEYLSESVGRDFIRDLKAVVKALQKPMRTTKKKPKVALVNVFMRPQSIGGATRVVEDNLDVFMKDYSDDFDVVCFSSDVHTRPPHRVSIHMDGPLRNYRATILYREHMDWHPRDAEIYRLFTEFLETEKPDIVHFHCVQRLTASVVEAARNAGIPYVVTVHDAWWISDHQFMVTPIGQVFEDGHPDPFAQEVYAPGIDPTDSSERRNHLKSLLLDAAAVTTVSKVYADIYAQNGITDIRAIRNGISETRDWREKDTSARKRVVIGHIGGMSAHKGYDLLRDTIQDLELHNIEVLVADHSMEENAVRRDYWGTVPVKFVGRVAQSRVVDLYRQIDVLAAPSIWPESFGLVTREAAACGCWVIASSLGGMGEDVINGETGFIIPPTQDALAKVLTSINGNVSKFKASVKPRKIRFATEQADMLAGLYNEITS